MTIHKYHRARTDYPDGVVAIYKNRKPCIDPYMVVYTPFELDGWNVFLYVSMSGSPYHPQGVCQHGESVGFRPTGGWGTDLKVIRFEDLPIDCQRVVKEDTEEIDEKGK